MLSLGTAFLSCPRFCVWMGWALLWKYRYRVCVWTGIQQRICNVSLSVATFIPVPHSCFISFFSGCHWKGSWEGGGRLYFLCQAAWTDSSYTQYRQVLLTNFEIIFTRICARSAEAACGQEQLVIYNNWLIYLFWRIETRKIVDCEFIWN